jgi:hypothetical protein
LLLGALIFLCGVGVGVGGMIAFGRDWMLRGIERGPAPSQIAHDLTEGLGLPPEKRAAVEAVIIKHVEVGSELRRRHIEEVTADMRAMEDEVARMLDPGAARKWHERMANFPAGGPGRRGGPPPGPPPPPPHDH